VNFFCRGVQDPISLQLFQVSSAGGFIPGDRLFEGISDNWGYRYFSPGEGLASVNLGPSSYDIYVDEYYTLPSGAPVMPENYIDSDSAMGIAEAAGGAGFRERHLEGRSVLRV